MKVRLALVTTLIMVLVGAVSIVGLAEKKTGTITASIDPVLVVTFTNSLDLGTITGQYNGVQESKYLKLTVQSNKDYTVRLECSGNLAGPGTAVLETEYALWKQMTWYDSDPTGDGPYDGWVDDVDFSWYDGNTTPTWFEASVDTYKWGKTQETNDFLFKDDTGYLPEHYEGFVSSTYTSWPDINYNYGGDLTLRIYPCLSPYENYATPAGSYSGTVTVTVTNVDFDRS